MAARQDDYQTATGWYADAVRAEPGRRALYEEALSALNRFIEAGLFNTDISVARNTANQANDILRAYQERFPDTPSPLRPSRLEFLIGLLEMNSGHPEAAREHLQSSVDLSEASGDNYEDDAARLMASRTFIEALIQLGLVTHRLGDAQGAVPILWRALEQMNRQPGEEINSRQASLFSFLGDALHDAGREQQSEHLYNQALQAWTEIVHALEGDARALATAQRGIVLDKLGQSERAIADFESALQSGPSTRPTYQAILSHLVTANPRPELARSVFRTAVRELTLEPEWKVYFALWVRIISSRANASLADDIQARLNEHSNGAEWWSKLAAFGAGELEGDSLIELANSAGERAEALFYVAQDRLAAGNRARASELFEDVLDTGMVNFHEYMMTLHVLPELRTTTRNSQE